LSNVAIYMRVSVLERECMEHTEDTINSQRNIIKSFIFSQEDLKNSNIEEFIDEWYSGSTTSRPGLDRLLKRVKQRKVDCIIVKDMSRFMRNYIEMGDYLENIFPFMGIRFIAINDGYDSSKEVQNGTDLDIQFKNLLNDYYCRDISEKMTTALFTAKRQGKYTSGNPPYGYIKDPEDHHQIIVDEAVRENVEYIFELILEGKTLNEVAKILNEEDVVTARKRRCQIQGYDSYKGRWNTTVDETIWSHSMVRRIVKNEVYTGTFVFHKSSKSKLDGGVNVYHPEEEWEKIYNHHEAIISQETYDEAQQILKSRSRYRNLGSSKYKNKSPLSGLLKCSKCGYTIRFLYKTDKEKIIETSLYCYHCRMLDEEEKLPNCEIIEKEVFDILKKKFHADAKDKKELLDEQKMLYDLNDKLTKKKVKEFERYKFGQIKRDAFIKIKNDIAEDTKDNLERIEAIDEELKTCGNIVSLTKETVQKYIKEIYISSVGIEKIVYR
jgi:site-specific DNA recombinase